MEQDRREAVWVEERKVREEGRGGENERGNIGLKR